MSDVSDMNSVNGDCVINIDTDKKNKSLSNNNYDDNEITKRLEAEPKVGYKKPFYYCKEHPSVQFIDYNEIIDHLKYSMTHQQST